MAPTVTAKATALSCWRHVFAMQHFCLQWAAKDETAGKIPIDQMNDCGDTANLDATLKHISSLQLPRRLATDLQRLLTDKNRVLSPLPDASP